MHRQNDQASVIYTVIALVIGAMIVAALFLFAIAAFTALLLTVLSLIAWNRPLNLGVITIEPPVARAIVYSGLAGAVTGPLFVLFCTYLFDFTIEPEAWPYVLIGGYTGGFLTLVSFANEHAGDSVPARDDSPAPPPKAITPPPQAPKAPSRPFDFADWDDNEVR